MVTHIDEAFLPAAESVSRYCAAKVRSHTHTKFGNPGNDCSRLAPERKSKKQQPTHH